MIETTEKMSQSDKTELEIKNNNCNGKKVVAGSTRTAPGFTGSHQQGFKKANTNVDAEENQIYIKGYN